MIDIKNQIKRKESVSDKNRLKVHEGEVPYISFPILDQFGDSLINAFSTRLGGVSEGQFTSMNIGFMKGDPVENVRENFIRFGKEVGFDPENTVCSFQTHTTNVKRVGKESCGSGFARERDFMDVDGLITDEPEIVLTTFYADCVPLYFYDPVHHAIGLSHSGWKGTVGNIAKETVEQMTKAFGSDPADMICAIGPSICQDCYEVTGDVIDRFKEAYPEEEWASLFYEKEDRVHYQLNLWRACYLNFVSAGVKEENISLPDICTCCNPEILFSHRASHGKRGNLAAFLMLKKR